MHVLILGLLVFSLGALGCSGSGDSGGTLAGAPRDQDETPPACVGGQIINGECVIISGPDPNPNPNPNPMPNPTPGTGGVFLLGNPGGHSGMGASGAGRSSMVGFDTGLRNFGFSWLSLANVYLHWGVSLGLDGALYGFSTGLGVANGAILKIDPVHPELEVSAVTTNLKASLGLDDGPLGSLSLSNPGSSVFWDSGQLLVDVDSQGLGVLYLAADHVVAAIKTNGELLWDYDLGAYQVYGSPVFMNTHKASLIVVANSGNAGKVLILNTTDGSVDDFLSFNSRIEGNGVDSTLGGGICVFLSVGEVHCPSFGRGLAVSGFQSNRGGLALAGSGNGQDPYIVMAGNVASGDSAGALLRVNIADETFSVLQLTDLNVGPFISNTSVSLDGGTAYTMGSDGILYAVSVNEFVLKWALDLNASLEGADMGGDILIDVAGRLYVSAGDSVFVVDDKGDEGVLDSLNSLVNNQRVGKWRYPTLYSDESVRYLFQVDTKGRLNRFSARD